jgi:hypothetical protein
MSAENGKKVFTKVIKKFLRMPCGNCPGVLSRSRKEQLRLIGHQFEDEKPKCSEYEHFFQGLTLYLEARIRIRIKVKGKIRIRIKVKGKIRIRIKVKSRGIRMVLRASLFFTQKLFC